jgi:hypothetical protein
MNDSKGEGTLLGYDIDLNQLVQRLWLRRRLVFASILGPVFLAIVYLHLAVYTYTATLMVSPVLSSSSNGISSIAGKLGGLASIAGIGMGNDEGTQAFMLYQEGLYSRDVAEQLAKNPEIMHTVYGTQWDAAAKQWIRPPSLMLSLIAIAKDVFGVPNRPWQPPNGALLQEYVVKTVELNTDPQKPVVTIAYHDENPQFAVKFLRELDRAVDNKLRANALVRANQYSSYLSDQLNKVTNTDIREALMTTLTDQEKAKMMASVTVPYAAQPFGLPSASRRPTSPRPFLVLLGAVFAGGLFGVLAALWLPPLRWPVARFKKLFGKPSPDTVR